MAWGDVDKPNRGGGAGRFVQFEDGKAIRLRILDEEPHTTRTHKIAQVVGTEEVFRSIPATTLPDDNFILKRNGKRYPDVMQFNMRAYVYVKDEKGRDMPDGGEIKILQGGPAIFKPLRDLYTEHGSLSQFDITIKRTGTSRDTEYTVSAAPRSLEIDVDALKVAMSSDATIQWENVFPNFTAEDQQKAILEAGFDIDYDPAKALAESMSFDAAKAIKFTFGKHKDKTVGDVLVQDGGYIIWAADNVTSNDDLAAACRVASSHMKKVSVPAAEPKKIEAKAPAPAAAKKEAPKAKEDPAKREDLMTRVGDYFEQDPRFEDVQEMVSVIKKHGAGKTRLKDLSVAQLESLLNEVGTTPADAE